ncbi:MAG TPA: GtrA family protein [Chitinophagaceae bacterium]|nr:GtrA family protein [Chitinophagaceae bacterium]
MFTFIKANTASLVASLCDYTITIIAVRFFGINVIAAGVTGTLCGGIINFLMGRHWVFLSNQTRAFQQAGKYMLVWVGNLLLNVTGLYLFTNARVSYVIAKAVTSITVSFTYNYPLQKKYVYKIN